MISCRPNRYKGLKYRPIREILIKSSDFLNNKNEFIMSDY